MSIHNTFMRDMQAKMIPHRYFAFVKRLSIIKTIATGDQDQANALGFLLKTFVFQLHRVTTVLYHSCVGIERKRVYLLIKQGTRGRYNYENISDIAIVSSK